MRTFDSLTQEDLELLGQSYIRLQSSGLLLDIVPYDDFLDAVVARGQYADTSDDYLYEEAM